VSGGWAGGSTRAWRRVRAQVLANAHGRCQLRLPGCTIRATCVHHVGGRARTGDDPAGLVAACEPCNLLVGDPVRKDPPARPVTRWTT
jgi:hypothetical protein